MSESKDYNDAEVDNAEEEGDSVDIVELDAADEDPRNELLRQIENGEDGGGGGDAIAALPTLMAQLRARTRCALRQTTTAPAGPREPDGAIIHMALKWGFVARNSKGKLVLAEESNPASDLGEAERQSLCQQAEELWKYWQHIYETSNTTLPWLREEISNFLNVGKKNRPTSETLYLPKSAERDYRPTLLELVIFEAESRLKKLHGGRVRVRVFLFNLYIVYS